MINLLPPQYKHEIGEEENYRLVLILGIIFLLFLVSLTLIFFSVRVYIQGKAESLNLLADAEEERLQTDKFRELHENIAVSNKKISELKSFYKTRTDSVAMLEKIFQKLPSQIYLTAISWQKDTRKVNISGFSPTRDILFALKNNLETTSGFSQINFPAESWIKPTDIFFTVSFVIDANDDF